MPDRWKAGSRTPFEGMVLLEGHGELCAEIFGKDQRRRRRASLRLAEAGGQMARRVGRLPAGSRRYGNTARKRFAAGPGCGIIRAHGFKRMFGKIGRKR